MRNGKYELVVAPEGYPGMKYRGRYAYEHRVVYWQEHGQLPEVVHHANGDCRDNTPDNLVGMSAKEHDAIASGETMVALTCDGCGCEFHRELRNAPWNKGYRRAYCSRSCMHP